MILIISNAFREKMKLSANPYFLRKFYGQQTRTFAGGFTYE